MEHGMLGSGATTFSHCGAKVVRVRDPMGPAEHRRS